MYTFLFKMNHVYRFFALLHMITPLDLVIRSRRISIKKNLTLMLRLTMLSSAGCRPLGPPLIYFYLFYWHVFRGNVAA